jgi:hypothetical protein
MRQAAPIFYAILFALGKPSLDFCEANTETEQEARNMWLRLRK